jgi:2,4-dienoyl-CoA reductase-like NADH-dependent reductase (Old Yellow Enzyme family)
VKAATFEGMAVDSRVSERLVEFHRVMAAGGVGMTTLAYTAVSEDGRGAPAEIVVNRAALPRQVTRAVRDAAGRDMTVLAKLNMATPGSSAPRSTCR